MFATFINRGTSQAGAFCLYFVLYITHIRWVRNSGFAQGANPRLFENGVFSPEKEMITSFIAGKSKNFFRILQAESWLKLPR